MLYPLTQVWGVCYRTSRFFWRSAALLSVAFCEAFCFFRTDSGTAMSFWVGTLCCVSGWLRQRCVRLTMSGPLCWWLVGLSVVEEAEE